MSNIETFELVKERCTLNNLNIRTELHGEERATAIDLAFSFESANNMLAKLHPDLRATFYRQDDNRDLVGGDHLPALKFPLLASRIGWQLEIPRTRIRIYGTSPDQDIILGDGKTNKFKLELLEGGTVRWSFRVQYSKPQEGAIAALSNVLNQTIQLDLACAGEEEKGDLFDQVEQQTQEPMSAARQEAEKLFGQQETQVDALPAVLPDDDVVDAEYFLPADTEPASNVEPIGRARRGGARAAGGGSVE